MLGDDRPTVGLSRSVYHRRIPNRSSVASAGDSTGLRRLLSSPAELNRVNELRTLAGEGRLAAVAASTTPTWRAVLYGAAFAVAWPVVFVGLTRSLERRRGHHRCASGVFRMTQECLDHFYDDVDAVAEDLLAHADVSIKNLEAWICGRLTAATVDGHRRRRGQLGALQRPRVPKWLSEALGQDRWFVDLAVQILNWVGVSTTAGSQLWPLDAWTLRRSTLTGDVTGSSPAQVGRDVDTVLAAMRRRPDWYAAYIERPLGHKQAPVALSDPATDQEPLMLGEPADADDASLLGLATEALAAISKRLRDQEDPSAAITEVIHSLFGAADALPGIDQPPHRAIDYQPRLAALLHDPERIARIVPAILSIVAEVRVTDLPEATGPGQVGQ